MTRTQPIPLGFASVTAAIFLLFSSVLVAHTDLVSSVPAANESLEQSPQALQLTFGDPVRLMRLTLTDRDGKEVAVNYRPTGDITTDHRHPLPKSLASGTYTLRWSAMADDGHMMTGRFVFSVGDTDNPQHLPHLDNHQSHDH